MNTERPKKPCITLNMEVENKKPKIYSPARSIRVIASGSPWWFLIRVVIENPSVLLFATSSVL